MTDPTKASFWRRYGPGIVVGLLAFTVIAVAAYVMGLAGSGGQLPETLSWDWQPTPRPGSPPPVIPYAQIDPAIMPALENNLGVYDAGPLTALGSDMPPVGSYLPQTGFTQFEIVPLVPPPTLAPLPTSAFLAQSEDTGIQPTESASSFDGPPLLPYGGDGCAPRGLPASGVLTQRFHAWHGGIDLGFPVGTPIIATHSGRVLFAGWSTVGYGNLVIVQNGSFITYYAHLSEFNVTVNQQVGAGSILALSGNTGNSTGPHLHYETRINDVPVDPLTFEARGYRWC